MRSYAQQGKYIHYGLLTGHTRINTPSARFSFHECLLPCRKGGSSELIKVPESKLQLKLYINFKNLVYFDLWYS